MSSDLQPDAFETYRQSISELYAVTGVADGGKSGFASRTTAYRFGANALGLGRSDAQTMVRTADEVRRSGLDHISVIFNLAATRGDGDGRNIDAPGGSVQFRDLTRVSASRVDAIDLVNLMVPRDSVPTWLLSRRIHGLVLPVGSPGGSLVGSHLKTLGEVASQLSEEEGIAAIQATFIIAERFLGHSGAVTPLHRDAIYRTIRHKATQMFDASAKDRNPDTTAIARAIGVSRSALYRAFEDTGGVQTYIRHRLLNRAHAALRLAGGAREQVAQVATDYGFSSRASFGKAFRKQFNFAPEDTQAIHASGRLRLAGVNAAGELDAAAHEIMLDWLKVGDPA